MKKMMIAAMMLLASSASFAGNSDVLKAILKAKTYTEAAQLLTRVSISWPTTPRRHPPTTT